MNLLQISKATKTFGPKVLFDSASVSVNEGEHIGVIGPNGAGKTTLFKVLMELEPLDSGEIIKSQQLNLGYLEQDSDWVIDTICEDYLADNCITPVWQLKSQGRLLGLTESHFKKPLQSLSGGYRMRMKLLYLLGQEPNLMLLDEPTNYLDLESVLALEYFLQNYKGAFLLISHDREFLKRTTEKTLEVESGELTKFNGHIDDYFEQKAQLAQVLEAEARSKEEKRASIQNFIDRFGAKATKAKQAQSRMKQLDKMEPIEIKTLRMKAQIRIPTPERTARDLVVLEAATLGYTTEQPILKDVQLIVQRETHLGVVGVNGAGKSTLLKSLAGRLPLLSGKFRSNAKISYFAQHLTEDLSSEDSVFQSLQAKAHSSVKHQEILNLAGALLFPGDDVYKKIKVLSGGERSRVALGQILLEKNPLLVLDEPTNHLDFETVEALTLALQSYEGSLIVVSHDRSFIRRVSTQILEIRNGRCLIFPGTYDDYVWSLEKGALREYAETSDSNAAVKVSKFDGDTSENEPLGSAAQYRERTKKLERRIKELQKLIPTLESNLLDLSTKQTLLINELSTVQGVAAAEKAKELSAVSQDILSKENTLLESMEELEINLKERSELGLVK